jgi:hypothetical protein
MTTAQILMLATEALAYDAVVVLWVTSRGTQPVLMPRSLGRRVSRRRGANQVGTRRSTEWPSGERVRSGT